MRPVLTSSLTTSGLRRFLYSTTSGEIARQHRSVGGDPRRPGGHERGMAQARGRRRPPRRQEGQASTYSPSSTRHPAMDSRDRALGDHRRIHNLHTVHVRLIGSGPGPALNHDGHGCAQPSRGHRRRTRSAESRVALGRSRHQPVGRDPITLAASITSIRTASPSCIAGLRTAELSARSCVDRDRGSAGVCGAHVDALAVYDTSLSASFWTAVGACRRAHRGGVSRAGSGAGVGHRGCPSSGRATPADGGASTHQLVGGSRRASCC
jgi:hypothetical protein